MADFQPPIGTNRSGRIRSKKLSTRIDMTPMVDLAFLLLTFFVLTATLREPFVIRIMMPEEQDATHPPPPINEKHVLTLILDENDIIYWYQGISNPKLQRTGFDEVNKLLQEKNRVIEKMVVLIKATDGAKYQNLVDIIDEMVRMKFGRYYLMDLESVDRKLISEK